ncbi:MAG: hypothetical protein KDI19_08180 [Pseudomonadales bacterium]|nr:hypothetical protein [Pseudomonadales bacterium]
MKLTCCARFIVVMMTSINISGSVPVTGDEIDRESYYEAAADIWARGCRGDDLGDREQARFHSLARDRFYTFVMSANHAQVVGDGKKIQSLIHSLALDLHRSPGLASEWRISEFAEEGIGPMVTARLLEVRDEG